MPSCQPALVCVVLATMSVGMAEFGLQESPDLSGRWILDPLVAARNTPRPPVCDRECVIAQKGRSVVVRIQNEATTFTGDGTPSTASYRSMQGHTADRTVTSRWEGAVLVIESVTGGPQSTKSVTSVSKLSLVEGNLIIEGTRPLITGEDAFRFVYRRCLLEPPKPCR